MPEPFDQGSGNMQSFSPSDVLFMHDGQNLFNASTSAFGVAWMCQDTINQLVAEGNMREVRTVPLVPCLFL
jgi:predicted alpha/beta superfamily hydrolase